MNAILRGDTLLCKLVNETEQVSETNGFVVKEEHVPVYEIFVVGISKNSKYDFHVGEHIVSASTGTTIDFPDGEEYVIFKCEHVACRIEKTDE